MAEKKVERLRQILLKEISQIVQYEMKDNKIGFITITDVKLTNDLSQATVFVNFLGSDNREQAGMDVLKKSKGFIRSELAKRLTIRKAPDLKFELDKSLEKGNRIDEILRSLNK
ncbi:ribosome-binding factor A [Bacilli bacterium PM5-3]|nr:ribosome-binding factor A [Bacilli bacterium PM5-3]MDH6603704.1 ribosome-binding factor A [Bacilli bacterium PM5-9]